ncbi:hypothetical protein N9137_02320 [Pseudomonadales bacterium]|nr:hypothetical protein [Pseudomonadales bacterium]
MDKGVHMFGLFKKKKVYTLLENEMITPLDVEIPTTQAKKIYRAHMQAIEVFEKDEISDRVYDFAEEIKSKEEEYRDDIQECKNEIKGIKSEISDLKKHIKSAISEEEKGELLEELEGSKSNLVGANEDLHIEQKRYQKFRKDKRYFLINYINEEIRNETSAE